MDARAHARGRRRRSHSHDLRVRQQLSHRRRAVEFSRRTRRVRHRDGTEVTSHFLLLVLFAFLVSTVFATLLRDDPRQQVRLGGMMFGGFVATAVVLGWLMYPLPL